jgi:hypothetical protein
LDFQGLSIDQAPPISAPLRFFITAPIFGLLAGLFLLFSDASLVLNRYSLESVVVTHLITIGFFGFVMLGALTQMLPVIAGATIANAKGVAAFSHTLLVVGVLSMVIGLSGGSGLFLWLALSFLGLGFFVIILRMLYAIYNVKHFTPSIKGMAVSLVFALFVVSMGIYLLYGHSVGDLNILHLSVVNIHSVWGIFGFAGILIVAVAYQVLPMFYVAPHFHTLYKRIFVYLIGVALILWMGFNLFVPQYAIFAKVLITLLFVIFALTVWRKLDKRKRPISDITVWYWRSAMLFLIVGVTLWLADEFFDHRYTVMVALFIGVGFILSVISGMLYKIVPFLVWFHLNAAGYMTIPTMNEMIKKKYARLQFVLFLVALGGFVMSFYMPFLLKLSAALFVASMVILEYNILSAVWIYKETKKRKPDFDMSAFSMQN